MINPTPPYGWRIVDKAKDDPSDFDRIMLWSGGRWEPVANTHFSPIDWMHYAVPIDPGPDHRLIDPKVDKPEDHPDAEVWLREGYGWTLRLQGDKCKHWCRNSVYRTPIKKAEPMPNEYDAEWFVGVPSEDEVGNCETCWVTLESGIVIEMSGYASRWLERPDPVIAWTYRITPKPYVPPKLPLPGEVWETRDKSKVFVVAKNYKADRVGSELIAVLANGLLWEMLGWTEKGQFDLRVGDHDRDLVKHLPNEPWPQEIVR